MIDRVGTLAFIQDSETNHLIVVEPPSGWC